MEHKDDPPGGWRSTPVARPSPSAAAASLWRSDDVPCRTYADGRPWQRAGASGSNETSWATPKVPNGCGGLGHHLREGASASASSLPASRETLPTARVHCTPSRCRVQ